MFINFNNLVITQEKRKEVINKISSFVDMESEQVGEVLKGIHFVESINVEYESDLEYHFVVETMINGKKMVLEGNHLNEMPNVYLYNDLMKELKETNESIEDEDLQVAFNETVKIQAVARCLSLLMNLDKELFKAEIQLHKTAREVGVY